MNIIFLSIINIMYIIYLLIISLLFELFSPIFFIFFLCLRKGQIDDAFRIHNWMYGRYLIKLSFPFIRIKITGTSNIHKQGSYVIVLNHPTFLDIFFSSLVPISNQLVIARNWVFDLKLFGWAMRLAKYINVDEISIDKLLKISREYSDRNVSFQFYPEGHRSKNKNLQRFRTGAFALAVDRQLPILPVCMFGLEKFGSQKFPFFRSAKVEIKILKPIYPEEFIKEEQSALKMRKYVKNIFEEQFN